MPAELVKQRIIKHIPESRISSFWQRKAAGLNGLVTEEDGPVTVVFPGYPNTDHGADFRDAILATRHGLAIGDIEVHVNSSGWRAHRHHLDPAYNRVVLHVVGRHDAGRAVELENGRTVPTLVMRESLDRDGYLTPHLPNTSLLMPCRVIECRQPEEIGNVLDDAGDERFNLKVDRFRSEMETGNPAQALYRAIMHALGYARNREPMGKLADTMTMEQLEEAVYNSLPDKSCLSRWQGLLLGTAGLLPSQRVLRPGDGNGAWVAALERAWRTHKSRVVMGEEDWHAAGVRPVNHPARRIAAMSHLLLRYRHQGLLQEVVGTVRDTLPGNSTNLFAAWIVPATGYWAGCLDFGQGVLKTAPALCGAGRAGDIVVNVALPFTAASLSTSGSSGENVMALYRELRGLPDNAVLRRMKDQLGMPEGVVTTARRQQGLLHIYREWCAEGLCADCPFGG